MNNLESRVLKRLNALKYARETHEIVKYAPEYYDSKGTYTRDEWSDFSDIGRIFNHKRLTLKQYLAVEDRYIHTAEEIVKASCIKFLTVAYIERRESAMTEGISGEMADIIRDIHLGKRLNISQSSLPPFSRNLAGDSAKPWPVSGSQGTIGVASREYKY